MPSLDSLIYDRTQSDVSNLTAKGVHNATDLNRVESWCRYLADELANYGYQVTITTKTNWTMQDPRSQSEMERIRANIRDLMAGFTYLTRIYSTAENFDYVKANNWEKILFELNKFYEGMKAEFLYSNTFYSGESEGLF